MLAVIPTDDPENPPIVADAYERLSLPAPHGGVMQEFLPNRPA